VSVPNNLVYLVIHKLMTYRMVHLILFEVRALYVIAG